MPLSTYLNLGLGELDYTKLTVELADRTVKHPKEIAKNVLLGIGKLIFPVDFIILDMPEDVKVPLILRRPFLSTAYAKIDVFNRKITLRVGDEKIIFKSVKPAIVKDMDPYLDEGMGEVVVREPFCEVSCVETRRFDGIITIYDEDDSVTYQRFKYLTNEQCNKIPRLLKNDDTSPWGNSKRKEKGEDGPKWIVKNKFEDELANFMLVKNKSKTPKPEAPTLAITTRSGISTQDPPFRAPPRPATDNFTKRETKKEGPKGAEPNITQEPAPRPSILYSPSKISNLPFPSRLKKQKKDDEDERLLSIFKKIHINLPFLEAMIHMPKGAKVLKDLLLHKEKLEKIASLVKLSEECSAIIQRSLPQKEETQEASHCHVSSDPWHIQLADWSIKYPIGVCENLLVKTEKEEDEDSNKALVVSFYPRTKLVEPLKWKAPDNQLKPSSVEPPKFKFQELPEHLEYTFLQEDNQLPVVISSALTTDEKTRLLEVLRNHKGAIAWSITDIKGIDSSFCTHKILMEDKFKPTV
ncbi:reverse transcriptase domain-containing protein [Tanacetum coccineum]